MKYKSISNWAEKRIEIFTRLFGRSNFSKEELEKNYIQVLFNDIASASKSLYSTHLYLSHLCFNEQASKRYSNPGDYLKISYSDCRNDLPSEIKEKISDRIKEVETALNTLKSNFNTMQELIEIENSK